MLQIIYVIMYTSAIPCRMPYFICYYCPHWCICPSLLTCTFIILSIQYFWIHRLYSYIPTLSRRADVFSFLHYITFLTFIMYIVPFSIYILYIYIFFSCYLLPNALNVNVLSLWEDIVDLTEPIRGVFLPSSRWLSRPLMLMGEKSRLSEGRSSRRWWYSLAEKSASDSRRTAAPERLPAPASSPHGSQAESESAHEWGGIVGIVGVAGDRKQHKVMIITN